MKISLILKNYIFSLIQRSQTTKFTVSCKDQQKKLQIEMKRKKYIDLAASDLAVSNPNPALDPVTTQFFPVISTETSSSLKRFM